MIEPAKTRIRTLLLAATCAFALACGLMLAGCGGQQQASSSTESSSTEEVVGGWEINSEPATSLFSEDEDSLFAEAANSAKDYTFNPIALLADQVVGDSGNYHLAFLAQVTDGKATKPMHWSFVFTLLDQENGMTLEKVVAIDPADLHATGTYKEPDLNRDWVASPVSTASTPTISEEAQAAFEKAAGDESATLKPIGLIATQIVAGTNYLYLAEDTSVGSEGDVAFAFVTVYQDLEGNCSITAREYVDLNAYAG